MVYKILIRAAVVLTVGWSVCVTWFAYLSAPAGSAFETAWSAPRFPRASDEVVDEKPSLVARLRQRRSELAGQARAEVAGFAIFVGVVWLVPIAAVWSIVWIFAPLSSGLDQTDGSQMADRRDH